MANQPHLNVIGNKWVFRIKRKPDGSIAHYKARLVDKGFHQRPEIDYKDTFNHVIKPQTIKMVLCIALSKGWNLMQMVNNAFHNGTLNEAVYMSQPSDDIMTYFLVYVDGLLLIATLHQGHIAKRNMLDAKSMCTLMATTSVSFESTIVMQRSTVASLALSTILNRLSQHMQNPTATRMQALKCTLCYLKHTISHGLHVARNTSLTLTAFCDVDWGW
ncbi:retrotransposon protein putative Ty1-copia subclass [Trifolium medium]|uniref:Retrotransposon protein putative Ty1-copia subclass n=1 Tax=Trifolium medium TaxID=97028 RepID=A0A392M8S0_9FABA|nr:retrotransposon protein putative Ty1-copia subclass [Trifolium medium]